MMRIIRSRPKFLNICEDFNHVNSRDEIFVNSGSNAISWCVKEYQQKLGKPLSVGIQSFNCESVARSILDTGANLFLMDINLSDFSISLEAVRSMKDKINVIVLTHYQGIPNQDYVAIAKLCKEEDIFLIDDICLTEGSIVDNVEVGVLGDVAIRSFAFDKPITSFKGGSIMINSDKINLDHTLIPHENKEIAKRDLFFLKNSFSLSASNVFKSETPLDLIYLSRFFPISFFKNSMGIKLLYRLALLFKTPRTDSEVKSLHPCKVDLILKQRNSFTIENIVVTKLEELFEQEKIEFVKFPSSKICWNRYSILDKDGKVKNILSKFSIEIGNYTWPETIHEKFRDHPKLKNGDDVFPNSTLAAKYILNIPIWYDFF